MSEFTYLFRGRKTSGSAEEMQQHLQKWVAWFKDLGAKGLVKDPGHPLENTGRVVRGKQKAINDGPYAEAKEVLGGYFLLEAADLDEAVAWTAQIPAAWRGKIELRPIAPVHA